MKQLIFLFLLLLLGSCFKPVRRNNFYYYSDKAFKEQSVIANPLVPIHTTVNGIFYTCKCTPKFVKKYYNWDDVLLVAVIPKKAKQEIKHIW